MRQLSTAYWLFWTVKVGVAFAMFKSNPGAAAVFNGAVSAILFGLVFLRAFRSSAFMRGSGGVAVWLLLLYICWTGISIGWSQTHSHLVALAYWLAGCADLGTVWLMSRMLQGQRKWESMMRGIVIGALILAVVVVASGQRMGDGRFGDFMLHPNTLGRQFGLAAVLCLCAWHEGVTRRSAAVYPLLCIIFVALTIFSLSKTSIVAMAVSSLLLIGLMSARRLIGTLGLLSVPIAVLLPTLLGYIEQYDSAAGDAAESLSGRTLLWAETWMMIQERPLLGYGYNSFKDVGPNVFEVQMSHAHNEVLQQWFSFGAIGAFLCIGVYLAFAFRLIALRRAANPELKGYDTFQWKAAAATLAFFLVRSGVEAGSELVFSPALIVWFATKKAVS